MTMKKDGIQTRKRKPKTSGMHHMMKQEKSHHGRWASLFWPSLKNQRLTRLRVLDIKQFSSGGYERRNTYETALMFEPHHPGYFDQRAKPNLDDLRNALVPRHMSHPDEAHSPGLPTSSLLSQQISQ